MKTPPRPARAIQSREALALACLCGLLAFTVQAVWARDYYGASVPFGDEWDGLVGFLASVHAGQLNWHLMFEPHMEHRIPVARAFFLLTYWVFGEASFLACLILSAALMGVIIGVWTYTLRRLRESIVLIAATMFVVMSPAQFHNILWGFQIEFYTLVGSVIAAICWLALTPRVTWTAVVGCAAACAISLYSIVSGILSWAVVGPVLFLRAAAGHRSVRGLLGARREWLQMGLFVALGLLVSAAYAYQYTPQHPVAQVPRTAIQLLTWFSASIVFPLINLQQPAEVWWLPVVVAGMFVPIAAALRIYWIQRDHARLLLVSGLVLNVLLNMAVIAVGRGAALFIAPRYGTVALWSSAAFLVAVASLWRETVGTRWRWIVAPALLALTAGLLGGHAWRYHSYTADMKEWKRGRIAFEQNIRAFVTDASPERTLAAFLPFPAFIIAPMMERSTFMAVMPYNLRPAARFTDPGHAWAIDRLPAGLTAPPDTFVFGSEGPASADPVASVPRTGTMTSTGLRPHTGLVLHVAGYPTQGGNSLAIESVSDPVQRVVFRGPDPGLRWTEWRIEPSQLPAGRVRIVGVDRSPAPDGWMALALPADKPASLGWFEAFVAHVEWWMAGPMLLALLWWFAAWRRDGSAVL